MKLFKNVKKQIVKAIMLNTRLTDKGKDRFTEDSIEDAVYDFMDNSQVMDLFHDPKKILKKEDVFIGESYLTPCEYRVNVEEGIIEPNAILMAKELDGIIQKGEGDEDKELILAFELLKSKLKEHKLFKAELKKKSAKWKIVGKGSWLLGAKFKNKDVWQDVDDGIIRATSIEGEASEWENIEE